MRAIVLVQFREQIFLRCCVILYKVYKTHKTMWSNFLFSSLFRLMLLLLPLLPCLPTHASTRWRFAAVYGGFARTVFEVPTMRCWRSGMCLMFGCLSYAPRGRVVPREKNKEKGGDVVRNACSLPQTKFLLSSGGLVEKFLSNRSDPRSLSSSCSLFFILLVWFGCCNIVCVSSLK